MDDKWIFVSSHATWATRQYQWICLYNIVLDEEEPMTTICHSIPSFSLFSSNIPRLPIKCRLNYAARKPKSEYFHQGRERKEFFGVDARTEFRNMQISYNWDKELNRTWEQTTTIQPKIKWTLSRFLASNVDHTAQLSVYIFPLFGMLKLKQIFSGGVDGMQTLFCSFSGSLDSLEFESIWLLLLRARRHFQHKRNSVKTTLFTTVAFSMTLQLRECLNIWIF